jgi:acetyl esterase/lipase
MKYDASVVRALGTSLAAATIALAGCNGAPPDGGPPSDGTPAGAPSDARGAPRVPPSSAGDSPDVTEAMARLTHATGPLQLDSLSCTEGYSGTVPVFPAGAAWWTQMDLTSGAGCNQPLILNVHGGGWCFGAKEDMQPLQPLENGVGMVYASIDYNDCTSMPAMLDSILSAIEEVRQFAPWLGVDPNRIGVYGESAGGQLALQAGFMSGHVRWIGSGYGPTDMAYENAFFCSSPASPDNPYTLLCFIVNWIMGGSPSQAPQSYQAYSPVDSYKNVLGAPIVPSLYFASSTTDVLVPIQQVDELTSDLEAAGVSVLYDRIPGTVQGGHGLSTDQADAIRQRAVADAFLSMQ